jgi:GntR family transcriptional regulator, arabinose operon transcriptional repressor
MERKEASKYKTIFSELRQAILEGRYKEGDRLESELQIAKKYGVSRPTAARALLQLARDGLAESRAGSGTYVLGRSRDSHYVFGLLIPELGQTEIFEPICQGLAQATEGANHQLLWGNTTRGLPKEKQAEELCAQYVSRKVSGVFFAPLELSPGKDETNRRIVSRLGAANIPVVLLDRDIYQYPERSHYCMVGIDNTRAGYKITEHLLKLGCRRIVFLGLPNSAPTVKAREAGWRDAMSKYGVPAGSSYVHYVDPSSEIPIREILKQVQPEAFVCPNDITAATLMQTLNDLGKSIPADIKIVGIDDVRYASLLHVPLTTVHQPCQDIGVAALKVMLDRISNPSLPAWDVHLDFQLVVRRSCGSGIISAPLSQTDVKPAEVTADG